LWHVYNSMIIWSWWNLVNRVTKLSEKYDIKQAKASNHIASRFDELNLETMKLFLIKTDIKWYLEKRYSIVQKTNEYISTQEPWKKYKDESTRWEAIECLQSLLYVVKNLSILSSPILIDWFEKIKNIFWIELLNILNTKETVDIKFWETAFNTKEFDININSKIIYPRVEE
jgi:methionyl-tRNA synthetase